MSRRRRDDPAPPSEPAKSAEGTRIDVRMSGTADEVRRQLGVGAEDPKPPKPEAPQIPDFEKFAQLLRNPKYIVKVKRLRPKNWQGQKAAVEVWTSELPLQWEEIKTEVSQSCQGGTYKVSVVDPQSGSVIDAQNFEVEGDPLLENREMTPEEKAMFGTGEKDAATLTEEGLERTARLTAKQIEVETYQQQLKELRNRGGNGKPALQDDARINELERRLIDAKHEAEIERIQREADKKLEDVNKKLDQLIQGRSQKPEGPSETALILQQMQKSQEASDKRFEALQKQMQDDKLTALLDEIKALKNKPQQSNMLEMAQVMLQMKKLFGWDSDDSDEDDPDDDRPWYEKALDKLGDKFIPKLIDKLDGLEASGKKIASKEDFVREIGPDLEAFAREVADKELAKRRIEPPKEQAKLPAPSPQAAKPEAAVPAAAGPNPPPSPQVPTLAQRLCQMAAGAVAMIEAELEVRPNNFEWHWNLWGELPQPILEKVCSSAGPVEMLDSFKIEGIDHAAIDVLKAKIAADPKLVAWLTLGFTELKGWWEAKQKNPAFDPEAEEEE